MRIYVDELPKDCICCPCESEYYCNLLKEDIGCCKWGEIHKNCPLQSISDYTKQVRKEVLSELRNMLGDRAELIDFGNGCAEFMFTTYDLQECSKEILDQIEQGETKGE